MCLELNNMIPINNKLIKDDFTDYIKDILDIH